MDKEPGMQDDDLVTRLWGIGKEVFASLGGGEAFIRSEREEFERSMRERLSRDSKP